MKIKTKNILYYVIPILFLILIFFTIFSKSIWSDEAFSLELVKHSFIDIVKIDAMDVHPPFYYIILKAGMIMFGWIFGGNAEITAKFVSFVPYIIFLIAGFTYIKNLYGKRVSLLFMLFVLGMPQMAHNAVEIRMYSWGMLFVTGVYFSAISILYDEKIRLKKMMLLTLFSVFGTYTHYFACISAFSIYMSVIILSLIEKQYKKIMSFVSSGIWVFISFLPWLFVLANQMSQISQSYWIGPVTFMTVIKSIGWFMYCGYATILVVPIVLVGFLGFIYKMKNVSQVKREAILGFINPVITLLVGIVISKVFRPIYTYRYIFFSFGCFWFAVSVCIDSFLSKSKKIKCAIAYVIVVSLIINISNIYTEYRYIKDRERLINWHESIEENSILAYDYTNLMRVVSHYFPTDHNILLLDAQSIYGQQYVYNESISDLAKAVFDNVNIKTVKNLNELLAQKEQIYLIAHRGLKAIEQTKRNIKYEEIGTFTLETYNSDVTTFCIYKIER